MVPCDVKVKVLVALALAQGATIMAFKPEGDMQPIRALLPMIELGSLAWAGNQAQALSSARTK